MKCRLLAAFVLAVSSLVFLPLGFGQGTDLGTIRGTVKDSSGAVVVNASVTVLDAQTGATRQTKTNSSGDYQMFGLPSGSYKVKIAAPGMSTADITGIVLNGSDVMTANAVLKVSTATENVEVTAEAAIIDTSDQTISNTISSTGIIDLPRDSRDVYQFLYLNPNITQGVDAGEFKFLGFQSYGATFTIDGQRATNTIFGSPTTSEPSLEAVSEVNVLSNDFSAEYSGIANIRISTKRGQNQFHGSLFYNNKNSALAAWQTQDIVAKSQFIPTPFQSKFPTPYFNFNDLGGSFGGPIPKLKKTWFFMAYERNYEREPVAFSSNKLPHPSFWTGDFSPLISDPNPANQNPGLLPAVPSGVTLTPTEIATDTYLGLGQQFVTIPSRLLNPNVQQLINTYFPKISPQVAIDSGTGRIADLFQTLLPGGSTRDLGTIRIDHDLSDNDHVYGVYNAQAAVGGTAPVFQPMTGLGVQQNDVRDNTLSGSYVHMFSGSLINEARGGFNRESNYTHSNITLQAFLSSIGFDQNAIDAYSAVVGTSQLSTHGYPFINFGSNFVTFGRNADRNTDRQKSQYLATFGDTLTWVVHNHNFKMGADFVRNVGQDGFVAGRGNPRGSIVYRGSGTDPFANFLLGEPASRVTFIPSARPIMDAHNWEQGYFFQDDWKFNSRLTLNLGLRYELVSPWVDKHDIMLNFDPTFNNNTGRFIIPSSQTLQYLDPIIPATLPVVTAAQSGLGIGRGLVRTDKNNFAPRVGLAFRVTDKSVVRGGYGLYFPTSAAQGIRDPLATNSFNFAHTKQDQGTALQPWPFPLTGGDEQSLVGAFAFSSNSVPVGLQAPTVHQYNATYERELGLKTSVRISYLGVTAHGLVGGIDLNEIAPSNTPWGTAQDADGDGIPENPLVACSPDNGDCAPTQADLNRLRYPNLGDFAIAFGNYGHSQSNSYQVQFDRRYAGGLMFNASYTYADQKSTGIDGGNSSLGGVPYDPFNPERDYTQDAWVSRHRFVFYGIYDLPVGRGKKMGSGMSGWADAVIGGWQSTFQMFAKSGTAFTPYWTCDNCGNGIRMVGPGNIASESIDALGDFDDFIGYRPSVVGNYKQHVADQLFNPNAFAPPPMGADVFTNPGIAKKNLLWGPGAWGVNFGVHKNFKLGERLTAQLGADFDNLFNHPIKMPNLDFADGSFSYLGGFNIQVNPNTLRPELQPDPTNPTGFNINRNSDFGRAFSTFSQEGVDSRRTTRLRLRITF
jgi:hypothetical protein